MQQSLVGALEALLRVIFLRGSPERIVYAPRLFIGALLLAVIASTSVQLLVYRDPALLALLRVFSEATMFMIGIVLLTRKVARYRLVRLMLVLVSISLLMDLVLLLAGLLDVAAVTTMFPYVVGVAAIYGAANALHWALQRSLWVGLVGALGYVGVVAVLDQTFRGLFAVMAG